jgi:hypothetical protein
MAEDVLGYLKNPAHGYVINQKPPSSNTNPKYETVKLLEGRLWRRTISIFP